MPKVRRIGGKHETEWIAISRDEYESMKSTLEVLSDPELLEQIQKSKKDIEEGRVRKWEDAVKRLGLR